MHIVATIGSTPIRLCCHARGDHRPRLFRSTPSLRGPYSLRDGRSPTRHRSRRRWNGRGRSGSPSCPGLWRSWPSKPGAGPVIRRAASPTSWGGLVSDLDQLIARTPEEFRAMRIDIRMEHEVTALDLAVRKAEVHNRAHRSHLSTRFRLSPRGHGSRAPPPRSARPAPAPRARGANPRRCRRSAGFRPGAAIAPLPCCRGRKRLHRAGDGRGLRPDPARR